MFTRFLHPAAWGGLLLNAALVFLFSYLIRSVGQMDVSEQDAAVMQMLEGVFPLLVGILIVQAVGLGLILTGSRFGIVVAAFGAFFMIPAALLYLTGCLRTHTAIKYASFTRADNETSTARAVFPLIFKKNAWIACAATFTAAIVALFMTQIPFFGLFAGFGCVALYVAFRLQRNPALSLHTDFLTLTPTLLADRLKLPFSSIRKATLYDDQRVGFTVDTPAGIQELRWPLSIIPESQRREAFEKLAEALRVATIPLE